MNVGRFSGHSVVISVFLCPERAKLTDKLSFLAVKRQISANGDLS